MKMTLQKDQFRFQMNQIRPDNFSYEGLGELFDYFEAIEEGTQTDMEFDPIAICCDFSQCSLDEFLDSYNVADNQDQEQLRSASDEAKREAISDYVAHNGFWHSFVEDGKEVIFENF